MSSADIYRQKSDALLREATRAGDLGERSRLISEAVRFNMMADEVERGLRDEDDDGSALQDIAPPNDP